MPSLSQIQNLSQQQILAPQLQQSLLILQAPVLELRNLIQQEIQTNPTLEEESLEPTLEDRKREHEEFQEEFERLQAEQEQERLALEAKERVALWQRRRLLNRLQDRALIIGAVLIVTIYLHLLFLAIRQMRIAKWGF